MAHIERRIGPDVKGTISVIVRPGNQDTPACSAIVRYTDGKDEHATTIRLVEEQYFKVGGPIKMTPIWRHITSDGVWSTEFSLAKDQS